MFSFFKKKSKTPADFAFLHTDMHAHLIPGIDDGAKTTEEALTLIRRLTEMGYRKLIVTPHIMGEYYPNTPERILSGLAELKTALAQTDIAVELEAAAEYYIDDFFENLLDTNAQLLTFSDNRLLVEFSMMAAPANAFDIIFQLNTMGYRPILAHPERYLYYANEPERFEKIKSLGCSLQVNLLSLGGHYGPMQKKLGVQLIKSGLVDFLGTDLHRERHLGKLLAVYQDRSIAKLLKNKTFQNINL